jgi:hypothetical protein
MPLCYVRYTNVAYPASYPLALMCDFSGILLYALPSVVQNQSVKAIMQIHYHYTHHKVHSVVASTLSAPKKAFATGCAVVWFQRGEGNGNWSTLGM